MISGILEGAENFFYKIIIGLVTMIYQIVGYTYQIFLHIADTNLFNYSDYQQLIDKIYIVLGVVLLFIMAYNVLTYIVDPDKNKGGKDVENLIKKVVSSLILILVMPTIFAFAMQVQTSVLRTNGGVINNFFSDLETGNNENTIKNGGNTMAVSTFQAFLYPTDITSSDDLKTIKNGEDGPKDSAYVEDDSGNIKALSCSSKGSCSLADAMIIAENTGNFSVFKAFSSNIVDEELEFHWFIAIIAGLYLAYCIISFCFDLAVRACKLVLYEIIAPLCIACRILPKKDDIFKTWLKKIWSTYMELFIRVIILTLGVFILNSFVDSRFFEETCKDCSTAVNFFANCLIVLGIVTFIKQAPKLIDEIFGLGGGVSFNIKKKLSDGLTPPAPILGGASVVAAGVRGLAHGIADGRRKYHGQTIGEKIKAAGQTAVRGAYGAVSAQRRALANADNVNSWRSLFDNDKKAVANTDQGFENFRNKWDAAGRKLTNAAKTIPVGIADAWKKWSGIDNVEELQRQSEYSDRIQGEYDAVTNAWDGEIRSTASKGKKASYGVKGKASFGLDGDKDNILKSKLGISGDDQYNTSYVLQLNELKNQAARSAEGKIRIGGENGKEFTELELERAINKYVGDFSKLAVEINGSSEEEYTALINSGELSNDEVKAHEKVRSTTLKLKTDVANNLSSQQIFTQNGEFMRQMIDTEYFTDKYGNVTNHLKTRRIIVDLNGNAVSYRGNLRDVNKVRQTITTDYSTVSYEEILNAIDNSIGDEVHFRGMTFKKNEFISFKMQYEENLARMQHDKNFVDKLGNFHVIEQNIVTDNNGVVLDSNGNPQYSDNVVNSNNQLTNAASMDRFRIKNSANGVAGDANKRVRASNDETVIPAQVNKRNESEKSTKK